MSFDACSDPNYPYPDCYACVRMKHGCPTHDVADAASETSEESNIANCARCKAGMTSSEVEDLEHFNDAWLLCLKCEKDPRNRNFGKNQCDCLKQHACAGCDKPVTCDQMTLTQHPKGFYCGDCNTALIRAGTCHCEMCEFVRTELAE